VADDGAPVGQVDDMVTLAFEHEFQDLRDMVVVFDHEDGGLLAGHCGWAVALGPDYIQAKRPGHGCILICRGHATDELATAYEATKKNRGQTTISEKPEKPGTDHHFGPDFAHIGKLTRNGGLSPVLIFDASR
jgi:hypothetical protein